MRLSELEAVVESLLFIAGDAVPLASIAQTIELDQATTRAVVLSLADKYEKEKRGLRIVEIADAYQMCTAAECFEYIRNMYKSPQRQGLTQSLLETLAIIAYKQPMTRAQVEEIRGVNSDHAVTKLLEKRLICEVGRASRFFLAQARNFCGISALRVFGSCRLWRKKIQKKPRRRMRKQSFIHKRKTE